MKNKGGYIFAVWWVMLCLVAGALILCFGEKDREMSDTENRWLQEFPELSVSSVFSGEFAVQFDGYMSDKIFGRDQITQWSENIMEMFSAQTAEDIALLNTDEQEIIDYGGETQLPADTDEQEQPNDADLPSDEEHSEQQEGAEKNKNTPVSYFITASGRKHTIYEFPRSNLERVGGILNRCAELLDDGKVYFTEVPLAGTANWFASDDNMVEWHSEMENVLAEYVSEDVLIFNTTEILAPRQGAGEYCWYKQDHHWSTLGAYYVCSEMIRSQGMAPVAYDDFAYQTVIGAKGEGDGRDRFEAPEMLWPTFKSWLVTNRTEAREAKFINPAMNNYGVYMEGRISPWRKSVTGANTGRKCLLIGDSFARAFAIYLTPYYDELHMVDVRTDAYSFETAGGTIAELMEYYDIDDIYVVVSDANSVNGSTLGKRLPYCMFGE